jgi:hypothetical protein
MRAQKRGYDVGKRAYAPHIHRFARTYLKWKNLLGQARQ